MLRKADNKRCLGGDRGPGVLLDRRHPDHRRAAAGRHELGEARSTTATRRRARRASCSRSRTSSCKGRAIYVREGCWYCHTQQTRTLVADTKRSRLARRRLARLHAGRVRLRQPAHVRDQAHRARPLARRRQVRHAVAPHALPQPARPGAGLGHAAVPVDRERPAGVRRARRLPADPRAAPRTGGPTTTTRSKEAR